MKNLFSSKNFQNLQLIIPVLCLAAFLAGGDDAQGLLWILSSLPKQRSEQPQRIGDSGGDVTDPSGGGSGDGSGG